MNNKYQSKAIALIKNHSKETLSLFQELLNNSYEKNPTQSNEEIKAIIIGCATYKKNQQNRKLLSNSKEEKLFAKHEIEKAQIYLDLAKEYFYICT